MRRAQRDHVELQSSLMQCAFCDRMSEYVHQVLRPASYGRRTDVVLYGTCAAHREVHPIELVADGYREGAVVPWEGLGDLLRLLEESGLL